MEGHLFVVRGDLTRLACDAIVLPCDDRLNINAVWRQLLPADLPQGDRPDWLLLPAENLVGNVVRLTKLDERRRVWAAVTTPTDTHAAPESVAERIVLGIKAAAECLEPQDGRELPLIALPLVGTGSGGLKHRRGELVEALLPRLNAASNKFDIALVVWDARDLAAVQHRRRDETDWTELTESLRHKADTLGELAGNGRLSLFIGAGVSKPVGLPDWWTLLRELAADAGTTVVWDSTADPIKIATPIVEKLGTGFHAAVVKRVDTDRHGIGHALLAGLRVQQMVTTNFDPCMELAMRKSFDGRYRVLTRRLADSSMPWLLKLHGDIRRPGSLVLSDAQYKAHDEDYAALRGVVQSLMLTSHLLFVGFSMTDQNFLRMASAVSRVRQDAKAEDGPSLPAAGTALALTSARIIDLGLKNEIDFLPMKESGSDRSAARILEIFLDRIAWAAARTHLLSAEYLMDERYASGLNKSDRALRDALAKFTADLPDGARSSAGWPRIQATLASLGAESRTT